MDISHEHFFHFLWENLHFSQENLKTTDGEAVQVLHPGFKNDGDGPDYRLSRIRINNILFCGDVELHRNSSDWYRHGHHRDSRYERVILHIVIRDDLYRRNVRSSDGHRIPAIELHSSLPASLSNIWRAWHRPAKLPCAGLVQTVPPDVFHSIAMKWDANYFSHRLNHMVKLYPAEKPMTCAWRHMLIRGVFEGLGYHKNQKNMVLLADFLLASGKLMLQHDNNTRTDNKKRESVEVRMGSIAKEQVHRLKNFLLASAGLDNMADAICPESGWQRILSRTDWDFSASRPANQPVARVLQASELAIRISLLELTDWMSEPLNDLWEYICHLEHTPPPGKNRRNIIFYNVIVPSVYLTGRWLHDSKLSIRTKKYWSKQSVPLPEKAESELRQSGIPPGRHFRQLGLLHHYNYFCRVKRCGECDVMKYLVQT